MKKKKSFKEFVLSDEFFETTYVVLMLSLLAVAFWFGIIETFL